MQKEIRCRLCKNSFEIENEDCPYCGEPNERLRKNYHNIGRDLEMFYYIKQRNQNEKNWRCSRWQRKTNQRKMLNQSQTMMTK